MEARRAAWPLLATLLVAAGAAARDLPTYTDYRGAVKGKAYADEVSRCEEVVGYPQLFLLWGRSSPRNSKMFLDELGKTDGVDIMEVHELSFEHGAAAFAKCHLNFYTNNNCGVVPSYSKSFMNEEYLSRTKGVGPFTVVLYSFNCSDTRSQGLLNLWRGNYSNYLRLLKAALRKEYATGVKFTIHGTMNRMEAMLDIGSLFGPDKYKQLVQSAKQGVEWNGEVQHNPKPICPTVGKRPCETLFEQEYDLEL